MEEIRWMRSFNRTAQRRADGLVFATVWTMQLHWDAWSIPADWIFQSERGSPPGEGGVRPRDSETLGICTCVYTYVHVRTYKCAVYNAWMKY